MNGDGMKRVKWRLCVAGSGMHQAINISNRAARRQWLAAARR